MPRHATCIQIKIPGIGGGEHGYTAKGAYHVIKTDHIIMTWLAPRLTPSVSSLHENQKIIFGLENAPYRRGFDPEVRMLEPNTKNYNTGLLHRYGADAIKGEARIRRREGRQAGSRMTSVRRWHSLCGGKAELSAYGPIRLVKRVVDRFMAGKK